MDRFATSNPVENECTSLRDLTQYCGGDFEGLSSKMDYIKGMNFDAVMVSSVVDQSPGLASYKQKLQHPSTGCPVVASLMYVSQSVTV